MPDIDYAGRCERYARQRGWAYDETRLSFDHLTPRQRRRALKKERHATPYASAGCFPDDDGHGWDEEADDNAPCSHCDGEWYMQECDDPIQCCDPRCDGQWHPCAACGGTGLAKHQVIW